MNALMWPYAIRGHNFLNPDGLFYPFTDFNCSSSPFAAVLGVGRLAFQRGTAFEDSVNESLSWDRLNSCICSQIRSWCWMRAWILRRFRTCEFSVSLCVSGWVFVSIYYLILKLRPHLTLY